MKKTLLDIGFDYDFVLYGIVSQESPHRLAWLINNATHSQFNRMDDSSFSFEEGDELILCRYHFIDELNRLEFDLFSNKDGVNYWLPELRKIDFFLIVKGALESFHKRKYTEPFKSIDGIQLISEIHHEKLKQKERLIF
jgi:hypothetical protein